MVQITVNLKRQKLLNGQNAASHKLIVGPHSWHMSRGRRPLLSNPLTPVPPPSLPTPPCFNNLANRGSIAWTRANMDRPDDSIRIDQYIATLLKRISDRDSRHHSFSQFPQICDQSRKPPQVSQSSCSHSVCMIKLSVLIGHHGPFAFCLGHIVTNRYTILKTKHNHFYIKPSKREMSLLQLLEVSPTG
jgi:hypothetical protein